MENEIESINSIIKSFSDGQGEIRTRNSERKTNIEEQIKQIEEETDSKIKEIDEKKQELTNATTLAKTAINTRLNKFKESKETEINQYLQNEMLKNPNLSSDYKEAIKKNLEQAYLTEEQKLDDELKSIDEKFNAELETLNTEKKQLEDSKESKVVLLNQQIINLPDYYDTYKEEMYELQGTIRKQLFSKQRKIKEKLTQEERALDEINIKIKYMFTEHQEPGAWKVLYDEKTAISARIQGLQAALELIDQGLEQTEDPFKLDRIEKEEKEATEQEKEATEQEKEATEQEKEATEQEKEAAEQEKEATEQEKEAAEQEKKKKNTDYYSTTSNESKTDDSFLTSKFGYKLKQTASIAVGATIGFALFGPLGAIAAGMISLSLYEQIHMSYPKLKLFKEKLGTKITEIKTATSKKMEENRNKQQTELDKLLSQPYNNYNLQIYKLKCTNQIKLLEKEIELSESTQSKKGRKTFDKLNLIALTNQLNAFKENLAKIEKDISNYNNQQQLTKINEKLIEINKQENDNVLTKTNVVRLKIFQSVLKLQKKTTSLMKYGFSKQSIQFKSKISAVKDIFSSNQSQSSEIKSIEEEGLEKQEKVL